MRSLPGTDGSADAREAVTAFLPVITERVGVTEVYGIRLLENAASGRVLEKSGFQTIFTGEGQIQGDTVCVVRS